MNKYARIRKKYKGACSIMLIKCPECELQVSDKAFSCPHCGYPIQPNVKPVIRKSPKRKRLPNGFGQISELKNRNLRKPFRAMITVGFNEVGKPISKLLQPEAYFKTYNEAYEALIEHNKNPYVITETLTLEELHERWLNDYSRRNPKSKRNYVGSCWFCCKPLYSISIKDIHPIQLKRMIDEADCSANIKSRMKSMLNMMFDYAVEYELINRNPAKAFKLSDEIVINRSVVDKEHIDFTDQEMKTLWKSLDKHYLVGAVIIQCFMGWRPQELCLLEISNVHLDEGYIVGGMKTKAGKDRTVPIHSKIKFLVEKYYNRAIELGSKYLFVNEDFNGKNQISLLNYDSYSERFTKIIFMLGMNSNHRPHDCRVQFSTTCKRYEVNEYAIKYMMGHSIQDITEKIYTKRGIDWLQKELEKIK